MVTMVSGSLLLFHFDYFAAFVLAAMRAHPVRDLGLMAIGALGQNGPAQRRAGPGIAAAPLPSRPLLLVQCRPLHRVLLPAAGSM